VEVTFLDKATIEQCWPQLREKLSEAINLEQGEPTLDDIKAGLDEGTTVLVQMNDGEQLRVLSSLALSVQPQGRTLTIQTLVGTDIADCLEPYMKFIDELAVSQQVGRIVITGRAGWARYLKDHGYTEATRTLVKYLRGN